MWFTWKCCPTFSFMELFLHPSELPSLNIHLETNYIMIQNTKSKYNVEWGSLENKNGCRHSEKETSLLNFHTRNYWAGLFKSIFFYELYMAIITEVHTHPGQNFFRDNLLINCQVRKIHSFPQIFVWFLISILNDLWVFFDFPERNMRIFDFHFQRITNLHMKLWKQWLLRDRVSCSPRPASFSPLPEPVGKILQVFACRRILLIRELTRQWKPIFRYFGVNLLKWQGCGMICNAWISRKCSSLDYTHKLSDFY